MKRLVISFIYLYRWLVSPFLPPSCSRYAISAIECHGLAKGIWMTLKRLCKCQPFSKAETPYDPIPALNSDLPIKNSANSTSSQKFKRVHNA